MERNTQPVSAPETLEQYIESFAKPFGALTYEIRRARLVPGTFGRWTLSEVEEVVTDDVADYFACDTDQYTGDTVRTREIEEGDRIYGYFGYVFRYPSGALFCISITKQSADCPEYPR